MNTKPKSNSVITHEVQRNENGGLEIAFKVIGAGTTTLKLENVSQSNKDRALVHGFIQRISDAAALSRNPSNGQPATPAEKLAAMQELVEHYMSGTDEWTRKRSGGGGAQDSGLLLEALTRMYPAKSREQLNAWLKARSAQERAGLMAEERVKATIDQIRAERAPKDVDAGALLAGLDEVGEVGA
jgi:hypothetical protein